MIYLLTSVNGKIFFDKLTFNQSQESKLKCVKCQGNQNTDFRMEEPQCPKDNGNQSHYQRQV